MLSVHGSPLGVYKEDDNMGAINGMLLDNTPLPVLAPKYLFLCGIIWFCRRRQLKIASKGAETCWFSCSLKANVAVHVYSDSIKDICYVGIYI